jgi:hypothetical protein
MSDRKQVSISRGVLWFMCGVIGFSIAENCIIIRDVYKRKNNKKIKQATITEMAQDSLQKTVEYRDAMRAYEEMMRKKQEIESGLNAGKNK